MSSVADAFASICNYLRREETALRGLGASDLKACLRTGAGTKGHTADTERYKHYRLLNKIEKDLTIEQRQEILEWEAKLCGHPNMEQSDATSFAQLADILQRRKTDLRELGKSSLEACFFTNKSKTDKDLKFGQNFFRRKAASLTDAQKEELAKWEAEICVDSVALQPVVDKEYNHLLEILEKRKTDLRELGKSSLEECFLTNKSNTDKDLKFGQNFFRRKAASLTDAQKEELAKWEAEICVDSVALQPVVDKEYNHLLKILEKRKTDLRELGKSSLEACFFTNKSKTDKDLKFGQNFFRRKAASLTDAPKEELAKWEAEICVDSVALQPAVHEEYSHLLKILEKRKTDLRELGKSSLEACFLTNKSNTDKDLKFGQNFFSRKAASLTDAQKEELAKWEAEICGDGVALQPAVHEEYNHLLKILEKRKTDLRELGKSSLEACFLTNKSKDGSGWLEEKLLKRTRVGTDALTLYAHSIWGEKCRVQRYIDADADIIYMIATACHIPKMCQNHLQLCGYGCICNGYHGFTERYARQLMFHALQYLGCEGVENRGGPDAARGSEGLGFVYELLGELGLHCPLNEQYHKNPDRRLQLFHLPKWAPKFLGESAREKIAEDELATWPPCQKAYFLKEEAEAALKAKQDQSKQFQSFEQLSLEFDKKTKRKNA